MGCQNLRTCGSQVIGMYLLREKELFMLFTDKKPAVDPSIINTDNEKCKKLNKTIKVLRDLTHGYINLTEIDRLIIDTPYFQRLMDIRQLTSQHVFANARHTRFEHSLGVMELTRQAVKYINKNRYISGEHSGEIIDSLLEFHVSLAALLHDIGHCPFSHLGENQFSNEEKAHLRAILSREMKRCKYDSEELNDGIKINGAVHEILSCIIIMQVYHTYFIMYNRQNSDTLPDIDWGLIVRCILGIKFENKEVFLAENIVINLINSDALDMDKLDYIMRDSLHTGISVPKIDTQRLFDNMFVSYELKEIVFKSGAVSVLSTIIETRDNLYLYVYNHHIAVYTDFIYFYIFRRLASNYTKYIKKTTNENQAILQQAMMPSFELFSLKSIRYELVSDSTLRSKLIEMYKKLKSYYIFYITKMDFNKT
jgi:HD superfamily phosphohydrolase